MTLPFSAVVGQEPAKRALLLAATQPLLAGVLLRGDKGSAKTTLARGLAALLPGDAPFVELPLGATEERVVGSLDLAALLEHGEPRFRAGLLAAANGGVLYVDEINLLADHLVDVLLDVAASGVNRVERDGFSHAHPARFVLVASMNPEEGELRPQLLDRFGLAVDVAGLDDVADRILAVRRQLAAETSPSAGDTGAEPGDADELLRERLTEARRTIAAVPDEVIEAAARLALAVGAEGLRADLMLCRAAAAAASFDGREHATTDDVRAVAELVLGHRRRRRPFDEPGISQQELDDAWQHAAPPPPPDDSDDSAGKGDAADSQAQDSGSSPDDPDPRSDRRPDAPPQQPARPSSAALPTNPARTTATTDGRLASSTGTRGRHVRDEPHDGGADRPIDARATAIAAATRQATTSRRPPTSPTNPLGAHQPGSRAPTSPTNPWGADQPGSRGPARPRVAVEARDLRGAVREQRVGSLVVFVVDASASMGVDARMAATKAAIVGLLGDAYRRRGRVALVTFRGDGAEVVLRPTGSVEIAKARLTDLATGGATPLAAGIDAATAVITGSTGDQALAATVVVVTDGRATSGGSAPVDEARAAMERLARTQAQVLVIDTEAGHTRLGLAAELAVIAGAECRHLDDIGHDGVESWVRSR